MKRRTFAYRVYFTIAPGTYYVVGARNARIAVWRAKRSQRAFRLHKRRTAPLMVAKIERLDKGKVRQLKPLVGNQER